MDNIELKRAFGNIAQRHGFERAFGGWIKESSECTAVLDLQKSNYGNYYELNIKIYIQGLFGDHYKKSKGLVKVDVGDIFIRQPNKYSDSLNLESSLDDQERVEKVNSLFDEFVTPFTKQTSTRHGIRELEEKGDLILLPAVKKQLSLTETN